MFPLRLTARLLQNFFIHADCNSIKKLRIKNLVKISFRRFFHFYQIFLQKSCIKYCSIILGTIFIQHQILKHRFDSEVLQKVRKNDFHVFEKCASVRLQRRLKFGLLKGFLHAENFQNKEASSKRADIGGGSLVWKLKTVYVMNMLHIWYLRVPLRMENMLNTYFDVIQAIENFLELHEVQKVIKNQLFSSF